jgi:hypothetical protein
MTLTQWESLSPGDKVNLGAETYTIKCKVARRNKKYEVEKGIISKQYRVINNKAILLWNYGVIFLAEKAKPIEKLIPEKLPSFNRLTYIK